MDAAIDALKADFFTTMNRMTKKELEAVIKHLSDVYYNEGTALISDEQYDLCVKPSFVNLKIPSWQKRWGQNQKEIR